MDPGLPGSAIYWLPSNKKLTNLPNGEPKQQGRDWGHSGIEAPTVKAPQRNAVVKE